MSTVITPAPHRPVMLPEVLAALTPRAGEIYLDGTLGAGGYTRAILAAVDCTVIAIDRDLSALKLAEAWKNEYGARLILCHGKFSDAASLAQAAHAEMLDGFVLDIGVSSMQLDQAERGFSFRFDGPLDMRMDTSAGETAADLVNTMDETDLADLIYQFGGERHSRRVARAIVKARAEEKITRTSQFAQIVRSAIPGGKKDGIDPATRTFQALRIAVNSELDELTDALHVAEKLLRPGGRLVVVTFHSLEDGIVKNFLQEAANKLPSPSRHLPVQEKNLTAPTFELPQSKAIAASDDEIAKNPRSRSAKLRIAIRTNAPARKVAA